VAVTVAEAWTAPAAAAHTGRIEAAREAEVATRTSGTLVRFLVDVGDPVRRGQLLAVLDDADVQARIGGAEAQRELAEQTYGRVERLAADGAASRQELDEMLARREAARAGVAEARAQAAYVSVAAPFDGVVVARMADAGDLAMPGRAVLRIAGEGAVKVVADLPAGLVGSLSPGARVAVRRSGGEAVPATVTRVVPTVDAASRRFRVEAAPEAGAELRAGEIVRLELPGGGADTRWIPGDAVVSRGQLRGVYALEADTLRLRWLRLGRTVGDAVEVLAGPAGALTVVRRPGPGLIDGQPVSGVTHEGGAIRPGGDESGAPADTAGEGRSPTGGGAS
jgi:RND family efflux transporter MFP subunit